MLIIINGSCGSPVCRFIAPNVTKAGELMQSYVPFSSFHIHTSYINLRTCRIVPEEEAEEDNSLGFDVGTLSHNTIHPFNRSERPWRQRSKVLRDPGGNGRKYCERGDHLRV
ncbi:hypothetical protein QE152_g35016 [Popillia japonica]|uniref:Uncharacterized protein n=1 Tax=Popillia japonica TaxID=7064 RepID=A0AAW1ISY3_POPJA